MSRCRRSGRASYLARWARPGSFSGAAQKPCGRYSASHSFTVKCPVSLAMEPTASFTPR